MDTKKIIIEGSFPEDGSEEAKFRVMVDPELDENSTKKDHDIYLSLAISGISKTLSTLLNDYEVLREPTDTELNNHFYYFTDDKALASFKARRKLHQELTEVFNSILRINFPDVEYINKCDEHLQDLVFNKPSKANKYQKQLKTLVEQVKKEIADREQEVPTEESQDVQVAKEDN